MLLSDVRDRAAALRELVLIGELLTQPMALDELVRLVALRLVVALDAASLRHLPHRGRRPHSARAVSAPTASRTATSAARSPFSDYAASKAAADAGEPLIVSTPRRPAAERLRALPSTRSTASRAASRCRSWPRAAPIALIDIDDTRERDFARAPRLRQERRPPARRRLREGLPARAARRRQPRPAPAPRRRPRVRLVTRDRRRAALGRAARLRRARCAVLRHLHGRRRRRAGPASASLDGVSRRRASPASTTTCARCRSPRQAMHSLEATTVHDIGDRPAGERVRAQRVARPTASRRASSCRWSRAAKRSA